MQVSDRGDGTYELVLEPKRLGEFVLKVSIGDETRSTKTYNGRCANQTPHSKFQSLLGCFFFLLKSIVRNPYSSVVASLCNSKNVSTDTSPEHSKPMVSNSLELVVFSFI